MLSLASKPCKREESSCHPASVRACSICLEVIFSPPYLACNRVEVHALKALAAGGAVCEPLGVCFAPFLIVEKHPFVLSLNPPELRPDRGLLLARTIQCGHRNISLPAHLWAIVASATNYSILLRLALLCADLATATYLQREWLNPLFTRLPRRGILGNSA
jgi:hypothetical protein